MARKYIPVIPVFLLLISLAFGAQHGVTSNMRGEKDMVGRMEVLNRNSPIEFILNKPVEDCLDQYLNSRTDELEVFLGRAEYYFPVIEEALDRYDLPLELKYIAVVESGLNPFARSKSGAVGIWQFLYNTCSLLELEVDSYIDERRDLYKSSDAACRYLRYLHNTFQDWNLVMAAYNGGPGEVRKAIARSGGSTDYWEIRPFLSEQAQNYLPKFITLALLMENEEYFHLKSMKENTPYTGTDSIHINYAVSFKQITDVLNISSRDLEQLNPVYKKNFVPLRPGGNVLILPEDLVTEYLRNEHAIISQKVEKPDYHSMLEASKNIDGKSQIVHTVEPGEYFHKIALKYNCTVENLMVWNELTNMKLVPGQQLKIYLEEN